MSEITVSEGSRARPARPAAYLTLNHRVAGPRAECVATLPSCELTRRGVTIRTRAKPTIKTHHVAALGSVGQLLNIRYSKIERLSAVVARRYSK